MCGLNINFKKLLSLFFVFFIFSSKIINSQTIQLNWTPVDQQNIAYYRIYRSLDTNTNFVLVNSISHTDSSYIDQDVEFDSHYFYVATSVDQQGNESIISNEAEIVTPKTYTLSFSKNPSEGGSVDISPYKSKYIAGQQVTVTATANAGYSFDHWSGDVSGNDAVKTITMNAEKTVIANFTMSSVSISGNIKYVNSELPLGNTMVNISGGFADTYSADENGYYSINSLHAGENYSVTPQRYNSDLGTSILSYDAALAAQIALNIMQNPSEISRIAADANGDGKVQMYDASLIAMQAIGLAKRSDSIVGDWGFYPLLRSYSPLASQYADQNFTATIRGDVDGNWLPSGPLAKREKSKMIYPFLEETRALPGSQISVPFFTEENQEILSFDICLKYDNKALKYIGLQKVDILSKFQIFVNKTDNGLIKIGGFSPAAIKSTGAYLKIIFEVIAKAGNTSQIELQSYRINAQPEQCATSTVVVEGSNSAGQPTDYCLYNNYPNPFNPETNIQYQIPENGRVTLKIYNMLGQEVKTLLEEEKQVGAYQAQWDGTNESGQVMPSGTYIYQLLTDKFIATKKMSLMK